MQDLKSNIIYEPDKIIKMGLFASLKEMVSNIMISRELIWRLFLRDFNVRYRQSFLGVLWAILNPIVIIVIFVFLKRSGILAIGNTVVPYPVFALIGITLYGVFSSGLTVSLNSIIGAGPMIVKINFPKISLVIAAMGQTIVELLVRLALIVIFCFIYVVMPKWAWFLFPLALLPLILLTLGIGLVISILAGVFRDIIHFIAVVTSLLIFLVPALYAPPRTGMLAAFNKWNPLSHLIIGCRDILILGHLSSPSGYLWSTVISVLIFLISWRIFFLSESKIAERV